MTPTMQEAISAFKSAYARELAVHPEDIRDLDELDNMIHDARAEMGQFAMATSVDIAAKHALENPPVCCGKPMSNHHRPKLRVVSVQGDHETRGVSFRCEECNNTRRPAHEQLGVDVYVKATKLFEKFAADFFLDKGAPTAVRRLKEHHGIEPGRTTVLNHVERRGEDARRWLDEKLNAASAEAERRRGHPARLDAVFVQMDSSSGKTVQPLVRPEMTPDAELTPVRQVPKVNRPIEGRQVKLLCAQAQGDADWVYDAYIGEFDDAPRRLEGLAATCGWQPGVKAVMTADGEEKNREMGEGAFLPHFQFILDHPHALGHLRDVITYGKDVLPLPGAQWMDRAIRRLHEGEVLDVVVEIRGLAKQVTEDKAQTKVDNVATYFKERADAVHYDKFKAEGWPLSSGKVEGGHIHFVHPISKRGSGWLVSNLNNTLALMCIRESNCWQEFWESTRWTDTAQVETEARSRKTTTGKLPDRPPRSPCASQSPDCTARRGNSGASQNFHAPPVRAPCAS